MSNNLDSIRDGDLPGGESKYVVNMLDLVRSMAFPTPPRNARSVRRAMTMFRQADHHLVRVEAAWNVHKASDGELAAAYANRKRVFLSLKACISHALDGDIHP